MSGQIRFIGNRSDRPQIQIAIVDRQTGELLAEVILECEVDAIEVGRQFIGALIDAWPDVSRRYADDEPLPGHDHPQGVDPWSEQK